ncbi:MAG: holin-associated N-acetylmuramidase [Marinosulfonomonas sp.]
MDSVDAIAEGILRREGGFVNDPDDPGGPTKFGVTLNTLRRLRIDVNRDRRIDLADVQGLSRQMARKIFISDYFYRPHIDLLPADLQPGVFDMYVNSGSNAVRILQRLLCDMGQVVLVDGVIGPKTAKAAAAAHKNAPNHLKDAYAIARRNYYYRLADRRPASRKFARRRDGGKGGWIVRAEDFMSKRYHLTEAQHKARIALWD